MGRERKFTCKKCGFEFYEQSGIGFLYPTLLRDAIENGKTGKLGEEMEEFFKEYPNGALNISEAAYFCKKCNAIKNEPKYTMYVPKEDGADVPDFYMPGEIHLWFRKYKNYSHKCEECGNKMNLLTANAKPKCPGCGELLRAEISDILWD